MCKVTVEELISTLETFEAEHCISISEWKEKRVLEVWESGSGSTIDYIQLPNS